MCDHCWRLYAVTELRRHYHCVFCGADKTLRVTIVGGLLDNA